jgi:uncharacterized protein YkwD
MKTRLRNAFALSLTVVVLFISYAGAIPAQAASPLTARNIVALANTDRTALGVRKVTEDSALDRAAQLKANDMAAKGYFSHVDPSGNQPWMWFKRVGYYYWGAAENLAINFDSAQSVNTAWMNSPSHKANLVNGSYSRMGIGIAHGMYNGKPATFVVQFFANPYLGSKVALR